MHIEGMHSESNEQNLTVDKQVTLRCCQMFVRIVLNLGSGTKSLLPGIGPCDLRRESLKGRGLRGINE